MPAAAAIGPGSRVWLNFSLALEDGAEVDTNFAGPPVDFVIGDGNLLPGFESLLYGMLEGERKQFRVPPQQAFGQHNESNVQRIRRDRFGAEAEFAPGAVFSFADGSGGEVPGVVQGQEGDLVTVDFNHPLAGRTILFEVEIHRVEPVE